MAKYTIHIYNTSFPNLYTVHGQTSVKHVHRKLIMEYVHSLLHFMGVPRPFHEWMYLEYSMYVP